MTLEIERTAHSTGHEAMDDSAAVHEGVEHLERIQEQDGHEEVVINPWKESDLKMLTENLRTLSHYVPG